MLNSHPCWLSDSAICDNSQISFETKAHDNAPDGGYDFLFILTNLGFGFCFVSFWSRCGGEGGGEVIGLGFFLGSLGEGGGFCLFSFVCFFLFFCVVTNELMCRKNELLFFLY